MIYPIVIYGSQTLRNVSVDIDKDYPGFDKLVEDMFLTLEDAEGVGLAAPQIGKNIRMFIVDCTPWGADDPSLADYRRVFVNPYIYEHSDQTDLFEEGCLSLPGLHENVRRPVRIRMILALSKVECRPYSMKLFVGLLNFGGRQARDRKNLLYLLY